MYMNLQDLFSADFGETLLRFVLCLLVNWGIVNYLYYKKIPNRPRPTPMVAFPRSIPIIRYTRK